MTENGLDRSGEAAHDRALRRSWHPVAWAADLAEAAAADAASD